MWAYRHPPHARSECELAAVRRRADDVDGAGEGHLPLDPLDGGNDALAGNGALHEDDLAVVPADHPAAGGGLLDRQFETLSWLERHGYS